MQNEIGFQTVRCHGRGGIDQFFFFLLQHVVGDASLTIPLD